MATIYDVAKAAGVSPKTVSRVINGDAPVNQDTRAAVNQAISDLNYVPSSAARTMRSRRSGLIGLITGAVSETPIFSEPSGLPSLGIVQGAQKVFAEGRKTLLISDTGGDEQRVPELVQTLIEHRVEGLLYVAEYHQRVAMPASLSGTKVVLANCFDELGTPAVVPDDEAGQHDVIAGLIERGHRRIGFLTLPAVQEARQLRLDGYLKALGKAGIGFDPALVAEGARFGVDDEFDGLSAALDRILALEDRPTVLCCANDKMALRVYALLAQRGIDVPEGISVVGYDDYSIIAQNLHPTLTSVELPYRAVGMRAAERLLDLITDNAESDQAAPERVSGPVAWRHSTTVCDPSVATFKTTTRRN